MQGGTKSMSAEPSPTNNVHSLRIQAGLSLAQLGAMLGVSRQQINQWESRRFLTNDRTRQRLADALGVLPDALGTKPETPGHPYNRFTTENEHRSFVRRLKCLRIAAGLSHWKLAEAAELTLSTVVTVETGNRIPQERTIVALAKALGVSIADLYFGPVPTTLIHPRKTG